MSAKTPIRTVFNDSNVATGLAEYQTGEFIPLSHGGIGAALSIGSAGQVLKVNTGGTALEFGAVEAIVNIDGATDLESATLVAGDKILLSDGGSEGRVLLSQLDTLFSGTTKTLTNKTLTTPIISSISNTGTITLPTSTDTLVGRATTDTLTNKTVSGASNTLSNIGNSSLSNSAITVGTTSISLGASATTIAGVSDLTAGSINIAGNVIKSNDSTIVEIGGGDGLSVAGNLTVAGNMTVSGSTTTVSSTNTTLADQFIELGTGRTGSASGDAGIVIERGSDANAIIGFDESADEFIVGTGTFTGSSSGNLTFTYGTLSSAGNKIYKAGTAHAVSLVASSSLAGNVTLTLPVNDGDSNQLLATDGSGNLSFISATAASGAGLSDLSDDSTPSLGGNLDMNGNDIITLSNANIDLLPHGTGKVIMDGNGTAGGVLVSDGLIEVKTGTGNVAKIQFYCETSNAHAQTLQAAPHSAGSSAVLTLPTATGTLIGTGDTSITFGGNTITGITNLTAGGINITGNSITSADSTVVEIGESVSVTGALDVSTNLTIGGNLTVNGTTTSIETTNSAVTDNIFELNKGNSNNTNDSGLIIERGSAGDNAVMMWDESADKFVVGTTSATADSTGNISHTKANFEAAEVKGSSGNFVSTGISAVMSVTGTDDGSGEGPDIVIKRNSASPADDDILGALVFKGENDADQAVTYGKVRARALDVSDGTEDGQLEFSTIKAGSITSLATMDSTGLYLNQSLGLFFEGDGADAHELKLVAADGLGADVTVTLPGATDTLIGKATTDTLTNKTLTSPKVNEDVAVTATATQLNHTVGVTAAIQTQLDNKAAKSFAIAQAVALG